MVSVRIGDREFAAEVMGKTRDPEWDYRSTKSITCAMNYEEAKEVFVDDVEWIIVYQGPDYIDEAGETVTPELVFYDNSEFSVSGPITDNRNGTVTVKMGKPTDAELLAIIMGG